MTVLGYIAAGLTGWITLAALGGFAWSFVVTRAKRLARREAVNLITAPLPPVRPTRESDAEWLSVWPKAERSPLDLVGYELDAKFYAVVAPSFGEYR